MLALGFKSDAGMYYFINKETRELVIVIIYIDNICFIGSRYSPLRVEAKIHNEIEML